MPDLPRYHSNASSRPRVLPGELPSAIGLTAGPDDPEPIGIACGAGWIGTADDGSLDAVLRLVVRGEA